MPRRSPRVRSVPAAPPLAQDNPFPEVEASRILAQIGTPEALRAIRDMFDAGERRRAALRQAAQVILAALPTAPVHH